jgi:hypothetical protein
MAVYTQPYSSDMSGSKSVRPYSNTASEERPETTHTPRLKVVDLTICTIHPCFTRHSEAKPLVAFYVSLTASAILPMP